MNYYIHGGKEIVEVHGEDARIMAMGKDTLIGPDRCERGCCSSLSETCPFEWTITTI